MTSGQETEWVYSYNPEADTGHYTTIPHNAHVSSYYMNFTIT